ncbi:MAG: glycosyltransferase [Verrucomicrobiota bacterium]|nr:glycosyltransferase [Verrucomicrobiota bacterium]
MGEQIEDMPPANSSHICVCLCTYRRPSMLKRLLEHLSIQETDGQFTFSISIADNDQARSAEPVIATFADSSPLEVAYGCQPTQNIALTRNLSLEKAKGDFVAFIDDDEFPAKNWLLELFRFCQTEGVSGVLGPVRPHFECHPPNWVVKGRFCDRPEPDTGTELDWNDCRTGNVLLRRSIIDGLDEPFDPAFPTGGEDKEFFRIMMQSGHRFLWCNAGVVFEEVPQERLTRSYMLHRALLRGQNVLKHPQGRYRAVATSFFAVPIYLVLLPFTVLGGHHCFVKYTIKLCDHVGRILGVFGINPVSYRAM